MTDLGMPIEVNDTAGEEPVRGFLHLPATPSGDGLVLTHGAGSNCEAPLLVALAKPFAEAGIAVLRCDLPFRQLHPKGPPMGRVADRDQRGLRAAVQLLRRQCDRRIFLGGHSYGGRQATMLAATDSSLVDGLLLLSYPLHPPGKPEQLRTAHFPKLRNPLLFIQGTRDPFGSPEEMTAALQLISAPTKLVLVEGTHSLTTAKNRTQLPQTILEAFQQFFAQGGITG
jgi:hypothetical protein